ncbi:AI-2E family transporter [Staphylospora marina]|uniref:AI-2E family transporter n=1 Tax=Staphylospora marina TaxID=2490858 RepID=UPI000F5BC172|nr:AI-2E family transporter [Staphylospora marina]
MPQTRLFRIGYGIILILLIVFLGQKVSFLFKPVTVLVQTLFFPFLLAGVLYYLFRPIVGGLQRWKVPKVAAILLIYLLFAGVLTALGFVIGPPLKEQLDKLVLNFPAIIETAKSKWLEWSHHPWVAKYVNWNEVMDGTTEWFKESYRSILSNVAGFFSVIANIVVVFVTVPFILYYMLKEGEKFPPLLLRILPEREREEGMRILRDMDQALSSYIKGQVTVSMFVGLIVYIGYLVIGLEYSLLLALLAMLTNVIPVVGPLIGVIPAIIVAFTISPGMAIKVVVVAIIAQQLEGNLVSPMVMGKSLHIHPLTIIVLLLVAGSLAGFLGLLLAVPAYAVAKVIISHFWRLYRLRMREKPTT